MKKKFKLFATIGSLALAICMMTIGVLAASTVNLTVTSTVTFGATSTYVDFKGTVSGGNLDAEKTITVKNYTTDTTEVSSEQFNGSEDVTFSEETKMNTWAVGAIQFVENSTKNPDGQTIVYKFEIKNPLAAGGAGLKAVITPTIPSDIKVDSTGSSTSDAADYTVTYQKSVGGAEATTGTVADLNNIAGGDTVIVTYTLTLNSVSASLTGGNVSFAFVFTRV